MFDKKINAFIFCMAIAALSFGCTKKDGVASPQKTLTEYVSRTFSLKNPSDRQKLVELSTGQVRAALEALDDQKFKAFFVDSKREFVSLKVRDERKIDDQRFSITYELTFLTQTANSKDQITTKKHAVFVSENGKWLISEVRSLKTLIEHQGEMSF